MSTKPGLVFVHGAWHDSSCWDQVIAILNQKDYKTVAINLPSASGDPSASLLDDIEVLRAAIRSETDAGQFVEFKVDAVDLFYHDLPPEEAARWAARLKKHSVKSLWEGAEYGYTGWKDVPIWFLMAMQDRALPPEAQQWMIGNAREEGADITVREVQSGHMSMLSRPEETAAFVVEAAGALSA